MQAWLESMAPGYGAALMWTLAVLIGLLILLVLIRIVRGFTFGTFVAGGKNRKARLAVMDATAVDSHRRLVLVRRDDVEHLILIGGPSDVVVEQNIRLAASTSTRRPPVDEHIAELPRHPQPEVRPAAPPPQPAPVAPPAPPRPAQAAYPASPARPAPPPVATAPSPVVPPVQHAAPPVQPAGPVEPRFSSSPTPVAPEPRPLAGMQTLRPVTTAEPAQPSKHDLDDALLEELEVTLDKEHRGTPPISQPSAAERSLDEEMDRLLSDLSGPKR